MAEVARATPARVAAGAARPSPPRPRRQHSAESGAGSTDGGAAQALPPVSCHPSLPTLPHSSSPWSPPASLPVSHRCVLRHARRRRDCTCCPARRALSPAPILGAKDLRPFAAKPVLIPARQATRGYATATSVRPPLTLNGLPGACVRLAQRCKRLAPFP
jgi:hypothetical protein